MLNYTDFAPQGARVATVPGRKLAGVALAVIMLSTLAACGQKAQKSGQALVSVNGEEITSSQLSEELQRANVPAAQQQAASKQLLESLVDRQLLLNEAIKDKVDREPKVVQAIERAKAMIIAQSYLQKKVGMPTRPTKDEVQGYFDQHPELFTGRKQLDMRQLLVATADISPELKKTMDDAKSLDEVAAWMDQHKVKYARNEVARSSADLPPALASKLLSMPKGQLFVIREGDRSVLVTIASTKDTPVDLAVATPQIEQYLLNTRTKEAASAEVARLRSGAKIDYLNKAAGEAPKATAAVPAAPAAPVAAPVAGSEVAPAPAAPNAAIERGVSGLK